MFDAEHDASLILTEDDTGQTGPSPIPRFRGRKHIGGEGMQTTMNKTTSPVRSLTAGTWVALFVLLALCLGALPAMAITAPPGAGLVARRPWAAPSRSVQTAM